MPEKRSLHKFNSKYSFLLSLVNTGNVRDAQEVFVSRKCNPFEFQSIMARTVFYLQSSATSFETLFP